MNGQKIDRRLFLGSVVLALALVGSEGALWANGAWRSAQHARADVREGELAASEARARAGLRGGAPAMARSLRDASSLRGVLDQPGPRRFLLVSQNPDEIRATGGFIGSAGVLEIQDGQLHL